MVQGRNIAVVEQFDRDSHEYLAKHIRAETLREEQRLFEIAKRERPYARALDIGCGPGAMSEHLLSLADEVWGIDTSPGMIALASSRVSQMRAGNRLHFKVGSAEQVSFPDKYFDVIFCIGVLRYLESPEQAIREIYRVLKPGGVFIATFYYRYSLQWLTMVFVSRPLLPLVLFLRGRPLKECIQKHRAEPLPLSYRRCIRAHLRTGFKDLQVLHSGFEFYPLRRLLPSLSRYIYLALEPRCFKSRVFGWLGSICILKGTKAELGPVTERHETAVAERPTQLV